MLQNFLSESAADENMTGNQVDSLLSLPRIGALSLRSLVNYTLPPYHMNKKDSLKMTISHRTFVVEYEDVLAKPMFWQSISCGVSADCRAALISAVPG